MFKRLFILSLIFLGVFPVLAAASPEEPVKIGDLFSYTSVPDDGRHWREGWNLAVDEINKNGGVLGRQLRIVTRDDKGSPSETIKVMEDFKHREKINVVIGTLFSHTGLAASSFAKHNNMLLFRSVGGTSKLMREMGHDRYLTIQPPSVFWANVLADKVQESGKKRWAFVVADYELSRSIVQEFQDAVRKRVPDITFVDPLWFQIGKMNAGAVTQVVAHTKPDGIFVVLWGSDYLRFVREGKKRALFKDRLVIGPFPGFEDYIEPLGQEAPVGWFSCVGYPFDTLKDEAHVHFVRALEQRGIKPHLRTLHAYTVVRILASAINAVGSDDPNKVSAYIKSHEHDVPGGPLTFRADGASNIGEWVGYTGFKNDKPTILDPVYVSPDKYLPSAEDNMRFWKAD